MTDNHLYNSTYPQPHADACTTEKILFNTMTYTFWRQIQYFYKI